MGVDKSKSCLGAHSVNLYGIEALSGKVHGARHSKLGVSKVNSVNAECEIKSKRFDKKRESDTNVIKYDELAVARDNDKFSYRSLKFTCLLAATTCEIEGGTWRSEKRGGVIPVVERSSDELAAVEVLCALKGEGSETMGKGFKVGDMVWGKIKSYPWWPGCIYDESLAPDDVRKRKIGSRLLVAFYGDCTYAWLDPKKMVPFDSNYDENSKQDSSVLFIKALEQAVYEVTRRAALGLACPSNSEFRSTNKEGRVNVHIRGYEPDDYSINQIEKAYQEFQPVKTLSFVRQLALNGPNIAQNLDSVKEVARLLSFRKAVYNKVDEPYFEAYGINPMEHEDSKVLSNNQEYKLVQAFIARTACTSPTPQATQECNVLEKRAINYPMKNKVPHDYVSNRKSDPVSLKPKTSEKQMIKEMVSLEGISPILSSSRKEAVHLNKKLVVAETSFKKGSDVHVQKKASLGGQSNTDNVESEGKNVKTLKLQAVKEEHSAFRLKSLNKRLVTSDEKKMSGKRANLNH